VPAVAYWFVTRELHDDIVLPPMPCERSIGR
jgi:hypothetical protein